MTTIAPVEIEAVISPGVLDASNDWSMQLLRFRWAHPSKSMRLAGTLTLEALFTEAGVAFDVDVTSWSGAPGAPEALLFTQRFTSVAGPSFYNRVGNAGVLFQMPPAVFGYIIVGIALPTASTLQWTSPMTVRIS